MKYSALIVAAGNGTRMNLGYNKVFYRLNEKTILEYSIEQFLNDSDCQQVVVVTDLEEYRLHVRKKFEGKIVLCEGGQTRQESVWNGLNAVMSDIVFVHDGARPYLQKKNIDDLKNAMKDNKAACLMVPCKDTIKSVKNGVIEKTLDRSSLMAAQTPQVFYTNDLIKAMEQAIQEGFVGTDDASLIERYSDICVKVVEGSYENIKITTPEDLK